MSQSLLKNPDMVPKTDGVFVQNLDLLKVQEPRTLVVTGTGRSGTTAVIRALHAAGLPKTGDRKPSTQDDHAFGPLLESGDNRFFEYADVLNDRHECWGFKWHNAHIHSKMLSGLRNPIVIAVFRDAVSTALRASSANTNGFEFWLKTVHDLNTLLVRFAITERRFPVVCVSYEKLVTETKSCVVSLCKAVNLSQFDAAIAEIKPSDPRYLYPAGNIAKDQLKVGAIEWSYEDDEDIRWYKPERVASRLGNMAGN